MVAPTELFSFIYSVLSTTGPGLRPLPVIMPAPRSRTLALKKFRKPQFRASWSMPASLYSGLRVHRGFGTGGSRAGGADLRDLKRPVGLEAPTHAV